MKIIGKLHDVLRNMNNDAIASFEISSYVHQQLLNGLSKDKDYSIEINEIKSKRSIQQNKYMWKLLSEIDVAINGKPTDEMQYYILALERANAKYEYIACIPEAEKELRKVFRAIKFIKEVDVTNRKLNMYKCFIGSSKMNVKEMNLLIDTVLDIAQEVGIETSYWEGVLK